MIGLLYEIVMVTIMFMLLGFAVIGFIMSLVNKEESTVLPHTIENDNSKRLDLRMKYEAQKMNETLTRNRNDSLIKSDHYGD